MNNADPQQNAQLDSQQEIRELQAKIDKIYASVEKTRKYFLWTLIITLVLFFVPLIGLIFVVPSFLSSYTSSLQSPGL